LKTLGIIPARAGSKRISGKNWRLLAGRPLADYALAAAAAAETLTEVVVTSDSSEVLALATRYPNFHCIPRPVALSTDRAEAITYVQHALDWMKERGHTGFEATCIVQPTSPFTLPTDIDATVRLLADPGADSAVSVAATPHDLNPLKLKVLKNGILQPYYDDEAGRMAAHDLPTTYIRNGSVYVSRSSLVESGALIGTRCRAHLMPRERSVDINDEFDWQLAEFLLGRKKTV
jgi:CMP-N,N'-diacetyllegionaminic acid synthase